MMIQKKMKLEGKGGIEFNKKTLQNKEQNVNPLVKLQKFKNMNRYNSKHSSKKNIMVIYLTPHKLLKISLIFHLVKIPSRTLPIIQ